MGDQPKNAGKLPFYDAADAPALLSCSGTGRGRAAACVTAGRRSAGRPENANFHCLARISPAARIGMAQFRADNLVEWLINGRVK
jgi:hypothetical protein